ncbi:MAG: TetR/AcrR family transcriptional regulator [Deltaproteobacteria bacterium]|jgi:TetR/AcrR family transcriptional regulator, cholesterol catabolism regulator|nr:TetR/AcrR family transcriptional regulator [Deltaproteobacteria bacterium]MBT4267361.1 TetR/AcrR family transcriptional regulator [Deltaproteobacteria bacterium]MBT4642558.1 TetR/AcrR family transcriptional regulator [Deltaproteobacteria bacterium]MBT4723097.1 TetR/AcrR family transcriptional regulator [Candidatus Falkowbacteria bacterium]
MSVIKSVITQVEDSELIEKKHKQIVKAANELFSKHGYHKTSMRDIAKATGINLSYLYNFISSKNDILFLFYKSLHKKLWVELYEDLDKSTDKNPVEQLSDFLKEVLIINNTYRDEIRTMYTETRHLEKESLQAVLSTESRFIRQIEKLISRGVEQGVFTTEDSHFAANIIQYCIGFNVLRDWNFKDRYTFTRSIDLLVDFVLKSLAVNGREGK